MDEQRLRIVEDLTGLLQGEVRCDPLTVAMFATDGSLYQVPPLGVISPRHAADVSVLAKYSEENKIPLIPRGAGTGLAGESLGPGLIIDFSRHMRNIEEIGESTVRVQPGVVCGELNRQLRKVGRYFPPDPSGAGVTTVGSMLALDAAGSHSVRVGSTRDHVQSLEVVLPGGWRFEAADELLDVNGRPFGGLDSSDLVAVDSSSASDPDGAGAAHKRRIIVRLARLLAENRDLISEWQPPLVRNRFGYHLRGILDNNHLRLARMLVGSEGTLGLFTAATLHTAPLPAHRGGLLVLFSDVESAVKAVQVISQQQPSACDLLDRRLLNLARDADPRFHRLIAPEAEAALIIEQTGFSVAQIRSRLNMVGKCLREMPAQSRIAFQATTDEEVEFLWTLPETVVPLLARMTGPTRPLPFVEDIAVPPEALHEFLVAAQNVFKKHRMIASLYSHAAAGQVHMRPFLAPPTPAEAPRLLELAQDLYEAVFHVGGTVCGEHGAGLARSVFVRRQYGPLYDLFLQVKQVFDPAGLLNPGKVLSDDPQQPIRNLRPPTSVPPAVNGEQSLLQTVPLQLRWSAETLEQTASRCNGCGSCRTQSAETRMCPMFRIDPREEASPRAKANLMRQIAEGSLAADLMESPEFKRIANLCFNCKQCQLECPSNVNIPQLMIEAKAAYVADHGVSREDWILSRAHSFGALGSTFSLAANWMLRNPVARWFLEKTARISRLRKLPRFARRSFLRRVRREFLKRPPLRGSELPVVYFVDHYANYHDPDLAQAFVEILRHNRIPVYVPPGQVASGMAMISAGELDVARELAERNVRELADLAREGCTIVCTEPAAALAMKQEYPLLIDHPDVEVVASRVVEAGAFLEGLHKAGRLRTDFASLEAHVGYHTPCHLKALGQGTPLMNLLRLIPDLHVEQIEKGCSGMAGAYGLTVSNFRDSLRIGWDLISRMRERDLTAGTTECSSCKIQMEQGTTTPTLHPLKLLAIAYGVMPELRKKMRPSRHKLVVT